MILDDRHLTYIICHVIWLSNCLPIRTRQLEAPAPFRTRRISHPTSSRRCWIQPSTPKGLHSLQQLDLLILDLVRLLLSPLAHSFMPIAHHLYSFAPSISLQKSIYPVVCSLSISAGSHSTSTRFPATFPPFALPPSTQACAQSYKLIF